MPPVPPFEPKLIPGINSMMARATIGGGNGHGSNNHSRGDGPDLTSKAFFDNATATRIDTDAVLVTALRRQYPHLQLLDVPQYSCDLMSYATAGHASLVPISDDDDNNLPPSLRPVTTTTATAQDSNSSSGIPSHLTWTHYIPPNRRLDHSPGFLATQINYGRFHLTWQSHSFLLYYAVGADSVYPASNAQQYLLFPPSSSSSSSSSSSAAAAQQLLLAAGKWASSLHDEVLVFDSGYWNKSSSLWQSVRNSSWDAVIMDPKMKQAIIEDHKGFFESKKRYKELGVPWKRGLIYHGPPGNGKTISIKATMNMLSRLGEEGDDDDDGGDDEKEGVPTLYVRSLASYMGPEYSIKQIFGKARQFAPCYLVFEDLDSIVSDEVRSYFLNEVDGLKANDGIFMVGSTNHLEMLDPGISKRPSRFDRKYYFPDPDLEQRKAYCRFWQGKLKGKGDDNINNQENKIDFPDQLCGAIAGITDGFSFAYIQEAFVAALLAIARGSSGEEEEEEEEEEGQEFVISSRKEKEGGGGSDDWVDIMGGVGGEDDNLDLDKFVLWREIKKQIEILREGMDDDDHEKKEGTSSS